MRHHKIFNDFMNNIRIDKKTGFAYIPKELRAEGYEGNVDTIYSESTITLLRPDIPIKSLISSLKLTLARLELRLADQKNSKKS